MQKAAPLFILLLLMAGGLFSQTKTPQDFGFWQLAIRYQGEAVDVLVFSKKGEENQTKPLFLFVQGSLPKPLIVYDSIGMHGVFPFDHKLYAPDYHLVIIGKPGVPVVSQLADLQPDFTYKDSKTGAFPELYCRHNFLDFYAGRNNAVLAELAKQTWVDKNKIVVAGHSEGSSVAAKMAATSPLISRLIYLSGNPLGRIMSIIARQRGRETAAQPKAEEEFSYWQWVMAQPDLDDCSQGDSNKATFSFSAPPIESLETLTIPVLVVYGTRDYSTPGNDFLRVDMIRKHKTNFTFKDYIGLDHNYFGFNDDGSINYHDGHWDEVVAGFFSWLQKN